MKKADITISTPQFERVDGLDVPHAPFSAEGFEALKLKTKDELLALGCQIWEEKGYGKIHWLYPVEWFKLIPEGLEIVTVSGTTEKFKKEDADDDMRFGALSFGFIQEQQND